MQRYLVEQDGHVTPRHLALQQQGAHDAGRQNAARRDAGAGVVHWSVDGWRTVHDTATRDTTLGVHVVDLPTTRLRTGDRVDLHVLLAGRGPVGGSRFLRLRRVIA